MHWAPEMCLFIWPMHRAVGLSSNSAWELSAYAGARFLHTSMRIWSALKLIQACLLQHVSGQHCKHWEMPVMAAQGKV